MYGMISYLSGDIDAGSRVGDVNDAKRFWCSRGNPRNIDTNTRFKKEVCYYKLYCYYISNISGVLERISLQQVV